MLSISVIMLLDDSLYRRFKTRSHILPTECVTSSRFLTSPLATEVSFDVFAEFETYLQDVVFCADNSALVG